MEIWRFEVERIGQGEKVEFRSKNGMGSAVGIAEVKLNKERKKRFYM